MRTIKLTIAYDGTDYAGWQIQPDRATVQSVLEEAIERVTGQASRTLASGRTDAGVHALGQVVGFRTDSDLACDTLVRALNANLPEDIAVLDAEEVADGFHPIGDAVRKRYRYVIHDAPIRDVFYRRYAWHCRYQLDVEPMAQAAEMLLGKHDFSSFESTGAPRESSVRTITDISVVRHGDRIEIEVEADGFLYNMVRAIVGTLVEIGRGSMDPGWMHQVLSAQERKAAGPTAPPEGLFLVKVDY
ncbi:MAG: tRNA pseudouridine(38-40) synthase TruA [Planctomycetia bacterium]|jgi:tRNA pseudouridine38-40 synthase